MIDRLLHEYAKKRREEAGAPLELRPVTRKVLLDEAARLFPPPATIAQPKESWLAIWWPRFAIAGFAVALLVACVVFWPTSEMRTEFQLARNGSAPEAPQRGMVAELNVEDSEAAREVVALRSTSEVQLNSNQTNAVTLALGATITLQGPAAATSQSDVTAAAIPALAQTTVSTQSFYFIQPKARSYRRNFNSPPQLNVLNSFELQQIGAALRVVDADGSIYEGSVRSLPGRTQNKAQIAFTVFGTNKTLNQPVGFTGQLLSEPSPAAFAETSRSQGGIGGGGFGGGGSLATLQRGSNAARTLLIHRVEGKASVGKRQELTIQAEGVER